MVHTLWVHEGVFHCAACCTTTAVLRTAVVVQGGWVDRFTGVSTGSWVSFSVFFPPALPAPRWHSSAYHWCINMFEEHTHFDYLMLYHVVIPSFITYGNVYSSEASF